MSVSDRERGSKRVHDLRAAKAKKPKAAQSPWPRQEGMLKFNPPELNDDERCSLQMMEAERKIIEEKIRTAFMFNTIKDDGKCP